MKTNDRLNPGSHVFDVDLEELDAKDLTPDLQQLISNLQSSHRDALDQAQRDDTDGIERSLLKASALTDQIEEVATRDETLARSASYHNREFDENDEPLRERAVARIDLNNFKAVNTAFGHEGGDRALHLFATLVYGVLFQNFKAVNDQTFEEFSETYDLFEYGDAFENPPDLSTLLQDTLHDAGSSSAVRLDGDEGDIEAPGERLSCNVRFTRPGGDEFALFIEADDAGETLSDEARERFVDVAETIGSTSLQLCAPDEAMNCMGVKDPERQRAIALAPLSDEEQTRSGGFVGQVSFGVGVASNRSANLDEALSEVESESLAERVENSLDNNRTLVPYKVAEDIADRRCEQTKARQKETVARRLQEETSFIDDLEERIRARGNEINDGRIERRTAS